MVLVTWKMKIRDKIFMPEKSYIFQIDFEQKSFFLYSPCTSRYHAFISIRYHIPPSSILLIQRSSFYTLDHLRLFRGSALLSDLPRYLKERNKRYGTEASNSRLFSRSTERTIRLLCPRPPFFSWLHFCPLLDILFYWTKPSFFPSFLPSRRSHLQPFALPSTIHARIRPTLPVGIYPPYLPQSPSSPPRYRLPSARNACPSFSWRRASSSATSFYSASRISNVIIHPSAKLFRES